MNQPPSFTLRAATTFGLGYCRPASGTWGSLPPVAIAFALALAGQAGTVMWYAFHASVLITFSLACVLAGREAEARFGKKDPGQVVADETAGMALVLLFVPPGLLGQPVHAFVWLAGAFVLWRLADIVKPWPANALQRLPAGWGILVDDLVAGLYAGLLMLIVGLPLI
jgi:phosphatidylglycerophosphatase A